MQNLFLNDYTWLFEQETPTAVWTTKDGIKISVDKMNSSHIHNCIKLLEGLHHYKYRDKWLSIFKNELKRRRNQSFFII